jgi:hypothetical protein
MPVGTAARTPRLPTREVLQEPADIDTWVIRGVSLLALLEARTAPVSPGLQWMPFREPQSNRPEGGDRNFWREYTAMPLAYALPRHSKRAPLSR